MKPLAGLALLGLLAIPADASNPNRIKKERPRPIQTAEPPLARLIPAPQPATAEPFLDNRVVTTVLLPGRAIARLIVDRVDRYRMSRLLNESEGPQPGVLTYERLEGAIGP